MAYVDAPRWASPDSEPSRWQPGQVLSYVRPLDAALVGRGPRMVFVRSDPNRTSGLPGPPPFTGFSDPVLSTVCPYPVLASCPHFPDSFFAFRFSPFAARSGGSANPVGLLFRGQRPDHPRRPVGEGHRDQHLRLTCQHPGQPRIRDLTASDRVCGRPQVGKPGFRTESVAAWSGTVVCPAS